jgi:hypothetical protein
MTIDLHSLLYHHTCNGSQIAWGESGSSGVISGIVSAVWIPLKAPPLLLQDILLQDILLQDVVQGAVAAVAVHCMVALLSVGMRVRM